MLGLQHILLEGRVDDAQQYFENAVGSWPVAEFQNPAGVGAGTNVEGVLDHFVQNDPSGNNKYLMWMVKMYVNPEERGTSPNDISSLVQRFHNNIDRIHPALIMSMDIFDPNSRIVTSPKNLDSYDDFSQIERVLDEVESRQTRKQKEEEAKEGVDKLYEDDRWLLVKPNTYEGSCYYGSSTKWCTAAKDNTTHFEDYSKRGNLYYIIDKSHELGDYYKIALFKDWNGKEEWYDRADDELNQGTINAIRSMLPQDLIIALDYEHDEMEEPEPDRFTLDEFRRKLVEYVKADKKLQKINTNSGVWRLYIDEMDGVWIWLSTPPSKPEDIVHAVQATPFWDGRNEIPFDFVNDEGEYDDWGFTAGPELLDKPHIPQNEYLKRNDRHRLEDWGVIVFLNHIYFPLLRKELDKEFFQEIVGYDYRTWTPGSYVSTFTFKYPPREGTMTQRFVDYLKQNPRKTSNQFYEDVLGYPRPRAHNNMFFSSIKDSGIVKMERQGRQFVYSLGPNYQAWVEGRLLRT
tara:strand:+ start:1421 stop:2971 length:1551 start_codon:yes stop_codon:yes gene_type:complete